MRPRPGRGLDGFRDLLQPTASKPGPRAGAILPRAAASWHAEPVRAIIATEPGGPDVLQIREVDPRPRAPDEILIRVVAAGVNRADLLQRQGHYPPPPGASELLGSRGFRRGSRPRGRECRAGRSAIACVALLAGVAMPSTSPPRPVRCLYPRPAWIWSTAAGCDRGSRHGLHQPRPSPSRAGEVFLVHGGAGGIGSFAIQYAKAIGAIVITTAGRPDKLDVCRSVGADLALSYRGDWPGAVKDVTDGQGVDVILDNMGAKYLDDHVRLLATGGRLAVIGMQGGTKGTLDLGALIASAGIRRLQLASGPACRGEGGLCRAVGRACLAVDRQSGPSSRLHRRSYPFAGGSRRPCSPRVREQLGKIILAVR